MMLWAWLGIYLAVVNLLAAVVTIVDKRAAIAHSWRISERTLLLLAALGGSVLMLATMHLIRHKTRHPKFVLGLPILICVQVGSVVGIYLTFFH